jgi:hypothetical protein
VTLSRGNKCIPSGSIQIKSNKMAESGNAITTLIIKVIVTYGV